jgi:hypothetical protein
VAIKLMITIEEHFSIIQKLLVSGFETKSGAALFPDSSRRKFEPSPTLAKTPRWRLIFSRKLTTTQATRPEHRPVQRVTKTPAPPKTTLSTSGE